MDVGIFEIKSTDDLAENPVDKVEKGIDALRLVGEMVLERRGGPGPVGLQKDVQLPRYHDMIKIGHGHEGQVFHNPQLIQHHAQRAGLFGRADAAQLMQRHLEFEAPAAKAGGAAAGDGVSFQHHYLGAALGEGRPGGQSGIAGANDHSVIRFHSLPFACL